MAKFQGTRQTLLAVIVAALHFAAFEALLALRPSPPPRIAPDSPPLTIVTLPRLQELGPAPADGLPTTAPLAIPALPPPLPALPNIAPAAPDPALAALGRDLRCNLRGELQPTEDREHCAKIMRDMLAAPMPDLPQTEEEKRLAQKFAHAQKVLEAPTVIPCLMGGIQLLCIAVTLITGDDFIKTYADIPNRKSDPIATGMVGRSGKTPGAP